jgi:hypothetical protein
VEAPAPIEFVTTYWADAHGCRGPDSVRSIPSGVPRVLLLGDSFTFGEGIREPDTFAALTERMLSASTAGRARVRVINCAVPGYSVRQMRQRYELGANHIDADLVIVVPGLDHPTAPREVAAEMHRLLESTAARGAGLVLALPRPVAGDDLASALSRAPGLTNLTRVTLPAIARRAGTESDDDVAAIRQAHRSSAEVLTRFLETRCVGALEGTAPRREHPLRGEACR